MSVENVNRLMTSLGREVGLEDLQLDAEGYCCLTFDETEVHFQYDDEKQRIVLFSRVGILNETIKADACEQMLAANLFWEQTNGSVLAFEPGANLVFLMTKVNSQEQDPGEFQNWLNEFIHTAIHWSEKIKEWNGDEGNVQNSPADNDQQSEEDFIARMLS